LISIPYADDLRDNKSIIESAGFETDKQTSIIETLTEDEKRAAKAIVKSVHFEFDSRNFENPSI
jgi:hypothetical protein